MPDLSELEKSSLLLAFVDSLRRHGSWTEETHVQKSAYFLQELLGVPLGCKFVLYKHGPFSFDLRADLTGMKAWRFLELEPKGRYGPSYAAGVHAQQLRSEFPEAPVQFEDQIEFVAERLGAKSVKELEQLGTALYVTLRAPRISLIDDRAKEVHGLKPHISTEEAKEAIREVDRIRADAANVKVHRAAS